MGADYQVCSPKGSSAGWEWYIAAAAHEIGHGLGLWHSKASLSIMGRGYDDYYLFFPLLDDIEYLWLVYGRPQTFPVYYLAARGSYQVYIGGPSELSNYPYRLSITQSGTNSYVFYYNTLSHLNSKNAHMIVGIITPQNLYRGAVGFFLSNDATDQLNRLAALEIDRDGNYFNVVLSYTYQIDHYRGLAVKTLKSKPYDQYNDIDAGYWVQIAVYIDNNGYTRVIAVVYKGTDYVAHLGADQSPSNLLIYNTPYVNIGFAVWTYNSNDPTSDYSFGPIYSSS